jgi:hypothetical protein
MEIVSTEINKKLMQPALAYLEERMALAKRNHPSCEPNGSKIEETLAASGRQLSRDDLQFLRDSILEVCAEANRRHLWTGQNPYEDVAILKNLITIQLLLDEKN